MVLVLILLLWVMTAIVFKLKLLQEILVVRLGKVSSCWNQVICQVQLRSARVSVLELLLNPLKIDGLRDLLR